MTDSLHKKEMTLKAIFINCPNTESKYQKIIELGKDQIKLDEKHRIPENQVPGCQSIVYMHSYLKGGKVYFETESDALISSGLAKLLTEVYSGEEPETVLQEPPDYLEELGISTSLTPSRANGLYSIHLRMKQDALKLLVESKKNDQ